MDNRLTNEERNNILNLDAVSGSSNSGILISLTKKQIKDFDVKQLLYLCLKEHKYTSFKLAREVSMNLGIWSENFSQTDANKLIAIFNHLKEGADALLTNLSGQQSPKVIEKHRRWLEAQGFSRFPTLKKEKE